MDKLFDENDNYVVLSSEQEEADDFGISAPRQHISYNGSRTPVIESENNKQLEIEICNRPFNTNYLNGSFEHEAISFISENVCREDFAKSDRKNQHHPCLSGSSEESTVEYGIAGSVICPVIKQEHDSYQYVILAYGPLSDQVMQELPLIPAGSKAGMASAELVKCFETSSPSRTYHSPCLTSTPVKSESRYIENDYKQTSPSSFNVTDVPKEKCNVLETFASPDNEEEIDVEAPFNLSDNIADQEGSFLVRTYQEKQSNDNAPTPFIVARKESDKVESSSKNSIEDTSQEKQADEKVRSSQVISGQGSDMLKKNVTSGKKCRKRNKCRPLFISGTDKLTSSNVPRNDSPKTDKQQYEEKSKKREVYQSKLAKYKNNDESCITSKGYTIKQEPRIIERQKKTLKMKKGTLPFVEPSVKGHFDLVKGPIAEKNKGTSYSIERVLVENKNGETSFNKQTLQIQPKDPQKHAQSVGKKVREPGPQRTSTMFVPKRKQKAKKNLVWCKTCLATFNSVKKLGKHEQAYPHSSCKKKKWELKVKLIKWNKKIDSQVNPTNNNMNGLVLQGRKTFKKEEILTNSCEICYKKFSTAGGLSSHLRHFHPEEKTFQCLICLKKFALKGGLSQHIKKQHKKDRPRPYRCQTCAKCYLTQAQLQQHYRLHSDLKPYVCLVCGAAYRTKDNFNIHQLGMSHI